MRVEGGDRASLDAYVCKTSLSQFCDLWGGDARQNPRPQMFRYVWAHETGPHLQIDHVQHQCPSEAVCTLLHVHVQICLGLRDFQPPRLQDTRRPGESLSSCLLMDGAASAFKADDAMWGSRALATDIPNIPMFFKQEISMSV